IHHGTLETTFRILPNIVRLNSYLHQTIPTHTQHALKDIAKQELSEEGLRWWTQAKNDSLLIRADENSAQEIPEFKLQGPSKNGSIEIEYIEVENSRFRANQVQEDSVQKLCEDRKSFV